MSVASKALEILVAKDDIKAAIESKGVTVGNAPLDQYANKIGQISGGGGGGFRCTNKLLLNGGSLIHVGNSTVPLSNNTYQYTFDGTLQSAGIALFGLHGGNDETFLLKPKNSNSVVYNAITITTTGEMLFQDHFCEPYYQTFDKDLIISPSLSFTANDLNASMSISNTGLLTLYTQYSEDPQQFSLSAMVIFKGVDGTYDFDIFDFRLYFDD